LLALGFFIIQLKSSELLGTALFIGGLSVIYFVKNLSNRSAGVTTITQD